MRMRLTFCFFLMTAAAVVSCKKHRVEDLKPEETPWPIAAIWAWGNFGSYIANNECMTPSLVVYSDGRIILKRAQQSDVRGIPIISYWTKILTPAELVAFQEQIMTLVKGRALESWSSIASATDQSETGFYFGMRDKGIFFTVYGLWLCEPDSESFTKNLSQGDNDRLPDNLFRYCAYLPLLVSGTFEPWKPEKIVVEFREDFGPSPGAFHWPSTLPGPDSPEAKRLDKRSLVVMNTNRLPEVQKIYGDVPRGVFTEIDVAGKNYRATYRFYFPGEELWQREARVIDAASFVEPLMPPDFKPPAVLKPALPKDAFNF